jgi:hypothetical protein
MRGVGRKREFFYDDRRLPPLHVGRPTFDSFDATKCHTQKASPSGSVASNIPRS